MAKKEKYDIVVVTNKILPYREPLFKKMNDSFRCFFIITQQDEKAVSSLKWLKKGNYYLPKKIRFKNIVPLTFVIAKLLSLRFKFILSVPTIYPEAWQAFLAAKIKKKKIIFWDEEFEWKKSLKRKMIMPVTSFMNRHADYILAPTDKHFKWLEKQGVSKKKFVLFPNVTNISPKDVNFEEVKRIKEKYDLNKKRIVMYVGQLVERKGVNYLIDAYCEMIKENDDIAKDTVLVIVGDGIMRNDLMKQSEKCSNRIIFTGYINNKDLANYYAIADVGVVPSVNIGGMAEPYALVVNEFLEFEKPVITTDMVGASYYFFYDKDIAKEKNTRDLKNKLVRIIKGYKPELKNSDNLNNNYDIQFQQIKRIIK